jgi:error-prone DNA polymerase
LVAALASIDVAARFHSAPKLEMVPETMPASPLEMMTTDERLFADYHGIGLTVGRYPMFFQQQRMNTLGVWRASELAGMRNGIVVRVAGCVIVRQRPGTAKGVSFLSIEDETGIFNVVVMPDIFDAYRLTIVRAAYVLVEGPVQNAASVIHVKVRR